MTYLKYETKQMAIFYIVYEKLDHQANQMVFCPLEDCVKNFNWFINK